MSRSVSNVRAVRSMEQIISLKPSNVQSASAWMNWMKMNKGKEFKVVQVEQISKKMFAYGEF